MKKLLFIFSSLLLSNFVYAQWSAGPTLANLGPNPSVSVASPSVAWVAGNSTNPVIYKTTNSGVSWASVPTNGIPNNVGIFCIFAIDANIAYAGDGTGSASVYITTNGGTNWTVLFNIGGSTSFFNGIVFSRTNANYGIAQCDPPGGPGTAYYLQKTTNGGANWSLLNPPGYTGLLSSQHSPFIIDNNFFGYGADNSGIVFITTNGGTNWTNSYVGRSGFVSALTFNTDKLNGMAAVSSNGLSKTTDGGLTWTPISVSGIDGAFLSYVYWIPGTNTIYASSSGGGIKKSTDAGLTWQAMNIQGQTDIRHMDFVYSGGMVSAYAITGAGDVLFSSESPLPVQLSFFNFAANENNVTLLWQTAFEINNSGFAIERKSANNDWVKIDFVNGNGNKSTPTSYRYDNKNLQKGTYSYRLKQIDYNGNFEYFSLNSNVFIGAPMAYKVSQNFPNPFNPETNINYNLPVDSKVSIKVYDIKGSIVATLADGNMTAGYHTATFDATNLPSGTYFYRIIAGELKETKKMLLVK
jgi:photosystem II stability/assembly factor-like uncharacterized protein